MLPLTFGALALLMSTSPSPPWSEVTAGEMHVSWRVVDDVLLAELRAPTSGWMAFGLNDSGGLAGTHFLMIARRDGADLLEEHVADPPRHAAVATEARLLSLDVSEGSSRALIAWPAPPFLSACPTLAHVMLAWSTHPELNHHSRQRRHLTIDLCKPKKLPAGKRGALDAAIADYTHGHRDLPRLERVLDPALVVERIDGRPRKAMDKQAFLSRARSAVSPSSKATAELLLHAGAMAIARVDVVLPTGAYRDVVLFEHGARGWRATHKWFALADARRPPARSSR